MCEILETNWKQPTLKHLKNILHEKSAQIYKKFNVCLHKKKFLCKKNMYFLVSQGHDWNIQWRFPRVKYKDICADTRTYNHKGSVSDKEHSTSAQTLYWNMFVLSVAQPDKLPSKKISISTKDWKVSQV